MKKKVFYVALMMGATLLTGCLGDDNKKNVDTARSLGLHTLQALGDEWIEAIVDKPLLF